jgi:hypothetical protein
MNIDQAKALLGERRIQVDSGGETFIRRCTKVDVLVTVAIDSEENVQFSKVWSDGRFGANREFETFMPVESWLALPLAPPSAGERTDG